MAVAAATTKTAAGSKKQRNVNAKKSSSFFGTMIRFTFLTTLFLIIFGGALLFHNCQISDKPWIPKSKGFCNDAKWSLQNMVIRNSLRQNFFITVESLQNITAKKFFPSAMTHANTASKLFMGYFENAKIYVIESFAKISKYVTENYGDQISHITEFLKHLASDITEAATEIFAKLLELSKTYAEYGYKLATEYIEKAQKAIHNWQHPPQQQQQQRRN
uniref:Uncharacterized protein n=1 Tax=Panagrolaimus sp. PS1159 TaxID=55785 RepID=A0AC35FV14_9BILA